MRWAWLIVGALILLVGIVWTLQGLNVIGGSGMSGNKTFVIVGPLVGLVGLLLVVFGARRRVRSA